MPADPAAARALEPIEPVPASASSGVAWSLASGSWCDLLELAPVLGGQRRRRPRAGSSCERPDVGRDGPAVAGRHA